jgi:hypothetical protein
MMFRSYRTYLLAFVVTLLLCGTSRSAELLTVGGCVDCVPWAITSHVMLQTDGIVTVADLDIAISSGPPLAPGDIAPVQIRARVWFCREAMPTFLSEFRVEIAQGPCVGSEGIFMPGQLLNLSTGHHSVPTDGGWAYLTIGDHRDGGEVLVDLQRINSKFCDDATLPGGGKLEN